jgi:hypothetical protein
MNEDKHLEALRCHVELVPAEGFLGDKVLVSYCEKCGYVELYHLKKKNVVGATQLSSVSISSEASFGWTQWYARAYLRNE